jgi:lysophospholipase L1-like esterase
MGTINNTTPNTFQITAELAQHFDAVRVIFANTDMILSPSLRLVGASVMGSKADLNNASGTWVTGSRASLSRIYAELSPGTERIAYTVSDWIPVSSVPRTDGGTKPLVAVRAYMQAHANLPAYGNGVDNFTNHATRTDGRIWAARQQAGVLVTSGFTDTTNRTQSPIVGIQYLSRGKVKTVAGLGDSITDGRGTYLGEGFLLPAIDALSDMNGTAYEYMNCGWSGQSYSVIGERAIDVLQSSVRPDVLVIPNGSPNDISTTISQSNIDSFRWRRNRVLAAAREVNVPVLFWTWLSSNASVKSYGATDSLRVAYNTEMLAQASRDIMVVDAASAINGSITGGQMEMNPLYQNDGIHPNDAGNTVLANLFKPYIKKAGGLN